MGSKRTQATFSVGGAWESELHVCVFSSGAWAQGQLRTIEKKC